MQTLLRHLLQAAGFTVTLAVNGLQAQDILAERPHIDIILSDVMMSGIDGIQFCRWVKEQSDLRDIPFIILSSRAQHKEREVGLQAGADAYMTKPFDVQILLDTIREVLA